jgi:hypothetical protein
MAYDYNSLTTFKPNAKKAARYSKVRDALSGKLGSKKRKQLRREYYGKDKKGGLKAYMNPVDPDTGIPLRDMERTARQEVKNRYDPLISDYDTAVRGQEQRTKDIDPWYDQWRTHLQTIGQSQYNAGVQQGAEIAAQAGKLQTQDVANQAQLANRAAGNSYAEGALQASKDASAGRAALAAGNAAAVKERGTIRQGMHQTFAGNSQLEQSRQKQISQGKVDELRKKKSSVEADAGAYFSERLDAQRANALDAQTKRAAAKMAGVKIDETTRHNMTNEEIAKQNADTAAQRADWATDPSNPDNQVKPGKPKTKYEYTRDQRVKMRDEARGELESATALIKPKKLTKGKYKGKSVRGIQIPATEKKPARWVALTPENEAQVRDGFKGAGIKNATLRAALAQQLIYQDVGRKTWDAVRRLGINPRNIGLKLRK